MYDVVAIGELLIDFIPCVKSDKGNDLFERNPGGAPANVLAALSRLGVSTAFIGKVGNDQFGKYLKDVLDQYNIDTSALVLTSEAPTTLAFVHLDSSGDRSFSFYRNPGADLLLNTGDVDLNIIEKTRVLHFGSVSMTGEPSRSATLKAVLAAENKGVMISYDPNLRPRLWRSLSEAKDVIVKGLEYCSVLKVSEEEAEFITDESSVCNASKILSEKWNIPVVLITRGAKGYFFRFGKYTGEGPAYNVNTIDTTGAGDAFMGAFLYKLVTCRKSINELDCNDINSFCVFANAAGSLATTKSGAIFSMPTVSEIMTLINHSG